MKLKNKIKEIHYGWVVMLGCNLLFFYGVGLTTGTFAVFLPSLTKEMRLSSTEASSILSIISTTGILFMLIVNRIFKKFGIRNTIFICGLLISVGNYLFSRSNSLIDCYVAAFTVGIGYGCCSIIPVSILITRWFNKKRGLAIGISYSGSGLAVIIFSPLLTYIIMTYGLRVSFMFQSICAAVMALTVFLLIRNHPVDKGLLKYGYIKEMLNETGKGIELNNFNIGSDIYFSGDYFKMIIIAFAIGMAVQPTVTHLPSFLISIGYKPYLAMSVISIYGFSMVIWKTLYGFIIDKLGSYVTNFIVFPLWIVTIVFSAFVNRSIICVYVFLMIIGIGPAIATVSLPIWVGDILKNDKSSSLIASVQITQNLGSSLGMIMMGFLFDLTNSYKLPFVIVIILSFIAFNIISQLYMKKRLYNKIQDI